MKRSRSFTRRPAGRLAFLLALLALNVASCRAAQPEIDKVLQAPPPHDYHVEMHNGAMTIFCDDEPITPYGWGPINFSQPTDAYLKEVLRGADFSLIRIPVALGDPPYLQYLFKPTWTGPGEYDFSSLDRHVERALAAKPDARLMLLVALDGAKWWTQSHPKASLNGDPARGIPDYLSEAWRADSREAIRALVAHCLQQDWGPKVVGAMIFNGVSLDCNFILTQRGPRVEQDFGRFLKQRYGGEAKLQKAWGEPKATFEDARKHIPGYNAWRASERPYTLVRNDPVDTAMSDWAMFLGLQRQQVMLNFARDVKEASHGRWLTGGRTAELLQGNWIWRGFMHDKLTLLLESEDWDLFEIWEPYVGRGPGKWGSGVPHLPVRGLELHEKLFIVQNDMRTFRSNWDTRFGRTPTRDSTLSVQRRIFTNALVHGMTPVIWQMHYFYDDPAMLADYQVQGRILSRGQHADRSTGAEVAFVIDKHIEDALAADPFHREPSRGFALLDYPRFNWARAGVAWDAIFLDQIEEAGPYKVYVFFHTIDLDAEQRKRIQKVISRPGTVAVFCWADGLLGPQGPSGEGVSELAGIEVAVDEKPGNWMMRAEKWFQKQMGTGDVPMGTLMYPDPAEPQADMNQYSPSFRILEKTDAKNVKVIAKSIFSGQPTIVEKDHGEHKTIYSTSAILPPSLLRYAARQAGVHEFTPSDAQLFVNRSLIGVHTHRQESVTLEFPEQTALYELLRDVEHEPARRFELRTDPLRTYLFFRGSREQWQQLPGGQSGPDATPLEQLREQARQVPKE